MDGVTKIIMTSVLLTDTIYQFKFAWFLEHIEKTQIHTMTVITPAVTEISMKFVLMNLLCGTMDGKSHAKVLVRLFKLINIAVEDNMAHLRRVKVHIGLSTIQPFLNKHVPTLTVMLTTIKPALLLAMEILELDTK